MSAKDKNKTVDAPNAETSATNKENIVSLPQEQAESKEEAPLTEAEQQLFDASEKAIESGLSSFIEIGKALKVIKIQKLHRDRYKMSFEDYCEVRWHMSRQHADRTIDAAECWMKLKAELPKGSVLPINEAQLRPLVSLDSKKWVKAWQKVLKKTGGSKITAEKVKEIVGVKKTAPIGAGSEPDDKSGDVPSADETDADSGTKQKLVKIATIVADALKQDKVTVDGLKKALVQIRDMLKDEQE